MPPAMPAAAALAAPTATAGRLALPAACLAVPATRLTRSVTLALPFCCAAAGFERDADFERAVDLAFVAFARAVGFDRDDAFAERLEALFAFGAEPLDDRLLDLLRVLLEAGLLFAILIPLLGSGTRLPRKGYPLLPGLTQGVAFLAAIPNLGGNDDQQP